MKKYAVGGWVRDKLMGIPANDKDYVVVGSTPEEMLTLGFEQVGKAFPVFLHPETKEEYALARKDKKVGNGYTGFEFDFNPSITLEEDLLRRDLTTNSIAYDEENDTYIDPYGGIADINNKVLRHTSDAFKDDPLRVLRVLRFAARYNFTIHPETSILLKEIIKSNDFKFLSEERFIVELDKVLKTKSLDYFKLSYDYKLYSYFYDDIFALKFYNNSQKISEIKIDLFKELNKKFDYIKIYTAILYNGINEKYLSRIDADIKQAVISYSKNISLLNEVNEKNLVELFFKSDYSRRPWILEYMLMFSQYNNSIEILQLFDLFIAELKKIDYSTIEISAIKPTKLKIWSELYESRKTFD